MRVILSEYFSPVMRHEVLVSITVNSNSIFLELNLAILFLSIFLHAMYCIAGCLLFCDVQIGYIRRVGFFVVDSSFESQLCC